MRVSRGKRDVATPDQFTATLRSFPRIVDAYGMFSAPMRRRAAGSI